MKSPARLARKQWEFVYTLEALSQARMLAPGKRGLGFGCGEEPLAAVMAKRGSIVTATDLETVDNVKQDGRFTDNHLGRSTGLIVGGYSAMFVAPSF
ncbi:hypothetical protein LMG22037_05808 [Paraburkholderia phenoliruptrix]|uniref:Uncharacterized protein n=1 Tax=Paraburkholderia phenoliruptrix TaxID=252970 RepID=A0A6J5CCB4_9BURK|nr:hypothetical protein [Paraburkholderia phenoliruptrix]CAB3733546.1 hypothetical protein LMG22037_05808 [Paraburkholderia phenoliruptrix]